MCKFMEQVVRDPSGTYVRGVSGLSRDSSPAPLLVVSVRTLMTRGMKSCYVYCCDPALREHLRWSASAAVEYDSEG